MILKTFINILIILSGQLLTLWIYRRGKSGMIEWNKYLIGISIFTVLTVIISAAVYSSRKTSEGSIVRAAMYSIAILMVAISSFMVIFDRSGIAWLPIAIPFVAMFSLPMAFAVSLGTIRILKDMNKEKTSK
jgi:hypothetical protein